MKLFRNKRHIIVKSNVIIIMVTLLFSCTNDIKKVRDFLSDQNLPIGVAEHIDVKYKDSGKITTKLISPLLHDFSNREEHPYSEFPKGIHITKIESGKDSTTVDGDYAISYTKTEISELKGHVVIVNYGKHYTLKTEQLFWDQKQHYFITEKAFSFVTPSDTIYGIGFESSENLENWHAKQNRGTLKLNN